MLFKDMKFATDIEEKKIKLGDNEINVKQYLPAKDKNSILEVAMQQADQGTILNTFALDAIFHVYVVIKYSDIEFTIADKEDLLGLYDILNVNGIIDAVVDAIPEEEYTELRDNLQAMVNNYLTYRNSARALVEQFSLFAPQAAEKLATATKEMDVEKFKNIIQLANINGENNKTNLDR